MARSQISVKPWPHESPPDEAELRQQYTLEGLSFYRWGNAAHDVYAAHTHAYHKVITVIRGSITFGLPDEGRQVVLKAGDRLDLPTGVVHSAVVGPEGISCLEGHR